MTQQSSFKKKIRARMAKTGERYAAARLALLKQLPAASAASGLPVLAGYDATPGVHADTARLTSALAHAGVIDPATGKAFTETKLFGLTGGIGFMYFLFEYKGYPPMLTFNCRTWTTPWPVIGKALEHAGIAHDLHETGGAAGAAKKLEQALGEGKAAHVTADFASLPWSGMPAMWRGQMGRQLNVVGRDDDGWVVDTGSLRRLDDKTMRAVRGAVKKEKHRLLTFEGGEASADPVAAVRTALAHTAHTFRNAPFKNFANNFGLAGLAKAGELIGATKGAKSWAKVFDSGPFAFRALYRVFECAMIELTPPAGGRPFYADFLDEAATMDGLGALTEAAQHVRASGAMFEQLADRALEAGGPLMDEAVALTEQIDELRRHGEGDDVGTQVAELLEARTALAEQCTLDEDARAEVYAGLAETFTAIHAHEFALVESLDAVL